MNKHVILGSLLVAAVACGGSSNNNGADAPKGTGDAPVGDAGSGSGSGSNVSPDCGSANAFGECPTGQKCTWVTDQNEPDANNCAGTYLGHVGCEPAGTVGLAEPCQFNSCNDQTTPNGSGICDDGQPAIGYDNCAAGTYCISGRCETMCNVTGGSPSCDANHACSQYIDTFGVEGGGNDIAGVCDERCDPNTQETRDDGTQACRSTNPAQSGTGSAEVYPNFGCYEDDNADPTVSFVDFTCSDSPFGRNIPGTGSSCSSGTVTDPAEDDQVCDNDVGCGETFNGTQVFFSNGCAPGYVNLLFQSTGSTTVICSAYCSPLDTDNTQPANGIGNGSALGKAPQDTAAKAKRATCNLVAEGGKATDPNETCVYGWPFAVDATTGLLPPAINVDIDTIGVCIVNSNYKYDPSGGTAGSNAPTKTGLFGPDCGTLLPGFQPTGSDACNACGSADICVGSGTDVCHEVDVACGSGSGQNANGDDKPGNEADCFAIFHSCYDSEEEGVNPGSGSGAAVHAGRSLVAKSNTLRDYTIKGNDRALFRRPGGIH